MKKMLAITLIMLTCISQLGFRAEAFYDSNKTEGKEQPTYLTVEEIMDEYLSAVNKYTIQRHMQEPSVSSLEEERNKLVDKRNRALQDNGYSFYEVNSDNYSIIEKTLSTNFKSMGLKPEYSYIVIVDANDKEVNGTRSSASYFSYTYNGITYSMRYLYVYADDDEADPDFAQADDVSVLNSNSLTVINNCLNTAVSAVLSSISPALGTVASICGLSINFFGTTNHSTMRLNGGTNWSRVYTQIYDVYDQLWVSGSSVEYVRTTAFMTGMYYSSVKNKMVPVPTDESYSTEYSSNYNDYSWRKSTAVIRYLSSLPCMKDMTGSVSYYYGNSLKFTHHENF